MFEKLANIYHLSLMLLLRIYVYFPKFSKQCHALYIAHYKLSH